mmetsp:Transcript_24463/g.59037  ORF Transcript_24463/g.59037 Transcript_24463/m.59037 type:complete len:236 (+) Transcript_24463:142-849(+)
MMARTAVVAAVVITIHHHCHHGRCHILLRRNLIITIYNGQHRRTLVDIESISGKGRYDTNKIIPGVPIVTSNALSERAGKWPNWPRGSFQTCSYRVSMVTIMMDYPGTLMPLPNWMLHSTCSKGAKIKGRARRSITRRRKRRLPTNGKRRRKGNCPSYKNSWSKPRQILPCYRVPLQTPSRTITKKKKKKKCNCVRNKFRRASYVNYMIPPNNSIIDTKIMVAEEEEMERLQQRR